MKQDGGMRVADQTIVIRGALQNDAPYFFVITLA